MGLGRNSPALPMSRQRLNPLDQLENLHHEEEADRRTKGQGQKASVVR